MVWVDFKTLSSLEKLTSDDPEALIHELVTLYLSQSDHDIELMKEAFLNQSFIEVSKIAHRLKSASLQLGVMEVSKQAQEIEQLAKQVPPSDDLNERVSNLSFAFQKSEMVLRDHIKNFNISSMT